MSELVPCLATERSRYELFFSLYSQRYEPTGGAAGAIVFDMTLDPSLYAPFQVGLGTLNVFDLLELSCWILQTSMTPGDVVAQVGAHAETHVAMRMLREALQPFKEHLISPTTSFAAMFDIFLHHQSGARMFTPRKAFYRPLWSLFYRVTNCPLPLDPDIQDSDIHAYCCSLLSVTSLATDELLALFLVIPAADGGMGKLSLSESISLPRNGNRSPDYDRVVHILVNAIIKLSTEDINVLKSCDSVYISTEMYSSMFACKTVRYVSAHYRWSLVVKLYSTLSVRTDWKTNGGVYGSGTSWAQLSRDEATELLTDLRTLFDYHNSDIGGSGMSFWEVQFCYYLSHCGLLVAAFMPTFKDMFCALLCVRNLRAGDATLVCASLPNLREILIEPISIEPHEFSRIMDAILKPVAGGGDNWPSLSPIASFCNTPVLVALTTGHSGLPVVTLKREPYTAHEYWLWRTYAVRQAAFTTGLFDHDINSTIALSSSPLHAAIVEQWIEVAIDTWDYHELTRIAKFCANTIGGNTEVAARALVRGLELCEQTPLIQQDSMNTGCIRTEQWLLLLKILFQPGECHRDVLYMPSPVLAPILVRMCNYFGRTSNKLNKKSHGKTVREGENGSQRDRFFTLAKLSHYLVRVIEARRGPPDMAMEEGDA